MKLRYSPSYIRFIDYKVPVMRAHLRRLFGLEARPAEVEGRLTHAGNVHAVFLIWQPRETRWYVRNALAALAEAGINVTLVVNHPLPPDRLEDLKAWSQRIMLRDNSGFDMGGYRDAILSFSGRPPDRLLILNDSVYYFRTGLTEMFRRLTTSECDVCGTFENWEHHHHIQSFCYSISRYILEQPRYVRFWKNYLPVNVRRWAINKGEVRSSRCMIRHARSTEVLFSPARLREALDRLEPMDIRDLAEHLPLDLRPGVRAARPRRELVTGQLLEAVVRRSQIHTGGFLYRRFLGAPMIKRDLLYRGQYHMHEIEALLHALGAEGHEQEILTEMRVKGIGAHLRGRARLRYELDL